ncbi:MAG: hypothetical protein ACRD0F_03360, partial [Acidimicrobiales bacterium]
ANWALAAVMVVAGAALVAGAARGPGLDLERYPVAAAGWLDGAGYFTPGRRVAATDVAGGYLVLRRGREARVFVDDRVDMYPLAVSRDYLDLLRGRPGAREILDRYGIEAVLWPDDRALVAILEASGGWRVAFAEERWVVLVRA